MTEHRNDPNHNNALLWQSQALSVRSAAAHLADPVERSRMRDAADALERLAAEAGARQAIATLRTADRSGPACSAGWHASPL